MRVVFIAFVVIFGLGIGYLALLVGPHALEPPMRYALAQDVTLTVGGRSYTAHEEVNCSVKDQRGSIASMAYNIDDDGQPPLIDLPGKGLVLISGFKPCRWVEEMPGRTPLVLRSGDTQSTEEALRGIALVFDDARSPKRVLAYPLAYLAGAKGNIGLREASLTGIETASPRSYDLNATLPFLPAMRAKQPDSVGWTALQNQAFFLRATIGTTRCKSRGQAGEGWISPTKGDCSTGGYYADRRWIPLEIDTGYSQLDLYPEDKSRPGNGLVIFGAAAVQMRGARHWTVKVCIEAKCFGMPVGGYQDSLLLVDRERDLRIEVTSTKWLPTAFEE